MKYKNNRPAGKLHISLRSKLMIMLLTVSICSMLAIAYLSYNTGQSNISDQIFNQLNSIRIAKANQIESYFENIRNEIDVLSEDLTVINAVKDFKTAYKALETKKLADNEQQKLNKFYTQQYLNKLRQNNGDGSPVLEQYIPKNLAARYLQYQYIANNPNPLGKKNLLDATGDQSDYNKIHSKYHPIFRNIYQKFGYYDIFLIDPSTGNIIYTFFKETDLGTNIFTGPYNKSNLAQSVSSVIDAKRKNYSKIVDFAPYKPSYDTPASFITTPIFEQSNLIGVLAFQISLDKVNQVMTGNKKWRKEGLGDTGESYIVGADYTMRSMSRLLAENSEIYVKKAEKKGLNKDIIEQIKNTETTILLQTVNTTAAKEALSGKEDTQIMTNYLDIPVISSYAPLQIEGLQWVIISEIALREAYASVYSFQKVMLIWGALIVLVITLVSMILSYIFIRPINILTQNARKISGGQIHGIVKIKSNDEFGELSEAFNEMVNSLQKQTATIKEKNQENEKLLLSIFPDSVAKRLKNGEQDISDHVDNVTVLVSDIVGFTRLYETMDVNHVLTVLNDLVTAFDETTEKYGVEKVKTIGDNYIAVCGLSVPRLDHAKRMVDFAMEMRTILRKFNYEKGLNLDISIIVHSGDVIAGIVGRKKFSYDVWGEAINTSNYIIAAIDEPPGEILVSHVVYQELYDIYEFEKFAEIAGKKDKKLLIWQLKRY